MDNISNNVNYKSNQFLIWQLLELPAEKLSNTQEYNEELENVSLTSQQEIK